MGNKPIIGIDLGTTNSAVAVHEDDRVNVLANSIGERTTPSVVSFTDSGDVLVGREAVNRAVQYPDRTIYSIKRRMGEDGTRFEVDGQSYRPEEISALILSKLVQDASANLGTQVDEAVITVPAYFTNRQRAATKRAGKLAGLTVRRLLNEPTAACLAHGLRQEHDKTVLVYDLGGGTFDVSVVDINDGVFEVIATDGLSDHGGEDWENQIVGQILGLIEDDTGRCLEDDTVAMQRIWDAAQQAKHDLTSRSKTTISIPYLITEPTEYSFEETLTRDVFKQITENLLEETIETCKEVMEASGLSHSDLDEVLLVGGATRMPQVADRLTHFFGQEPAQTVHPNEVVAEGAAVQASIVSRSLPTGAKAETLSTDSTDNVSASVAGGNQGRSLPTAPEDVVLIDVVGQTLGVDARIDGVDDRFSRHIPRNSSTPAKATEEYVTISDNQTSMNFKVYQGESEVASENTFLDKFTVGNIPPAPKGQMTVRVEFHLDQDGILHVEAENMARGNTETITVTSEIEFTQQELEQMENGLPEVR
ncbi:Hsp70 family protein [Halobacteriaceae archaeon SHR40]|uniref:Hsp70 family protein n=1 Tax=Halovenus amylolytica TaxID=2500550 RepID=UPI000FE39AA7